MKKQDEFVRYCSHCGCPMKMTVKYYGPNFNNLTGLREEKGVNHYWVCPRKVWMFDSHDKYNDEYDPNPYQYF